MADLRTQLRAYVEATIERVDVADVAALRAVMPRPTWKPANWLRPALALGTAFALTLAAVGTTLLLLSRGEEAPPVTSVTTTMAATTTSPEPSTTLAPTTTATTAPPATTTTVPAFPDALGMTWTRVADQEAFRGGNILSAIQGGPGLVAVGASMENLDACVWLSADGLTWERISSPAFAGEVNQFGVEGAQWMADVAAGPQGLVAVGADNRAGAVVWTSPDGRSWTRLPADPEVFGSGNAPATLFSQMNAVIAAGPGLVAVGSADNQATVWTSADGTTWTRVFTWSGMPDGQIVHPGTGRALTDVVAWEGRLYAVGWTGWGNRNDPESTWIPYRPIVLVSQDGTTWEMLPQAANRGDPGVHLGNSWPDQAAQAKAGRLLAYEGGLVVTGFGPWEGRAVMWRSADGVAWVRGGLFVDHEAYWPDPLVAHEGRLLLGAGEAEIWGSVDGGTFWHRIALFPLGNGTEQNGTQLWGPGNYVSALLAVGDTVMAFGMDSVYSGTEDIGGDTCNTGAMECRSDAAIWIGTFDNG